MTQLLKIEDYVSRYEWDPFRYPSQFIKVKTENWNKLYAKWENADFLQMVETIKENLYNHEEEEKSRFLKLKSFLKKEEKVEEEPKNNLEDLPETEEELKQYFLDKLLNFQLKWATSTLTETSFVDKKYYYDPLLKYLLQRFPDIYLLMYKPIFNLKGVPVDGEIILISPLGIEILHFMEYSSNKVIMAGDERTWTIDDGNKVEKTLSPIIALKRTEKIIKSILDLHSLEFPLSKTILSRTNPIVYGVEPYQTTIIGKKDYDEWFEEKRRLRSPLKSIQLKVASSLLKHCQTTSVRRPEWEEEHHETSIVDLEE